MHLKGTYNCSDASYLEIFGSLVEIVGGKAVLGQYDKVIPRLTCDGHRQYWQSSVFTTQGTFAPGKAVAMSSAIACGDVVCVFADKVQVLRLAHGIVASSISATVTSSRTHTSFRTDRASRRTYPRLRPPELPPGAAERETVER